jgi:hypothetical protein
MPFRSYTQFNSEALRVMTDAYDAVVAQFGILPSDPRTAKIAAYIVALVSEGETNAATLCKKACAELSK